MQSNLTEADANSLNQAWSSVWWLLLIQGVITVGFGLFTILNPTQTPTALVKLLGIFIAISGFMGMVEAFLGRKQASNWTGRALSSFVVVIVGVIVFAVAQYIATLALSALLLLVGVGAAIVGIVQLMRGFRGRQWSRLFWGAIWVLFAFVLFTQTQASATVFVWITGFFLLLLGLFLLVLSFRLRRMKFVGTATYSGEIIEGEIVED